LIPKAEVELALGTSMVVMLPAVSRRKPWSPTLSEYCPTIWPLLLIPKAEVELALGTSMVVKLPPVSNKKPWVTKSASRKIPTIWPLSLIPEAEVELRRERLSW
jgi:hypothetical protein